MSKHRRKKDKALQLSAKLPPAELKPAWIYDIATMYAKGYYNILNIIINTDYYL